MPMQNSMRRSGGSAALLSADAALDFGRASDRVDDAGELDQESIAGGLDEAALMAGDLRVDHLGTQRLEPDESVLLVGFDQPRITARSAAVIAVSRRSTRPGPNGPMTPP